MREFVVLLRGPEYSSMACLEPLVAMVNNPLGVLGREPLHFIPWANMYPSVGQNSYLGLVAQCLVPPLKPLPIDPDWIYINEGNTDH